MPAPIPGKLPLGPAEEEEEEASRNFPTSLALVSRAALSRALPSPPAPATEPAADSPGPAAAPGQRELPARKVSSFRRGSHPGGRASGRDGLGAWRLRLLRLPSRAPAAATAEAALRPVPAPRSAHTGTSLAAQVPALARVPEGTFPVRARRGCASRAPPDRSCPGSRTRWGAARQLFARRPRPSSPSMFSAGSQAFPEKVAPLGPRLDPCGTGSEV